MGSNVAGEVSGAKILIVEDDRDSLELLAKALYRSGFDAVIPEIDPRHAAKVFALHQPHLVILDYHLPPTNAISVMAELRRLDDMQHPVPIIMLTGSENEKIRREALAAGVADFLSKSYDPTELVLRVRNALKNYQLFGEVKRQKMWLEELVRIRTQELNAARREVVERLAIAAEYRDYQTGEHTRRVGRVSGILARKMGSPPGFAESLETAALLHDIGKIAVPDHILLKPSQLTPEEYEVVKQHALIGAEILGGCNEPVMSMACEVSMTHHERWDGQGYPHGLRGASIPLSGRIVAVADAYDAMRSDRPYKRAMLHEEASDEILEGRGTQFDPDVVSAFLAGAPEIVPLFDYGNASSLVM